MSTGTERYADLLAQAPIPERGILSQTLSDAEGVTFVLFSFAAGEELSEHTSARPAIVHLLQGEADCTVGGEAFTGGSGLWFRMAPGTAHSIRARTGLVMALTLLPKPA